MKTTQSENFPEVIFISGIDTNIGKTYATALLQRRLEAEGRRVITQKFIQTGNEGSSEDIECHRRLLERGLTPADEAGLTAPIIFTYPASPHLAARLDRRTIDLALVDEATQRLGEEYGYDTVLLEGAGGLMVPITEEYLTIDYIADRGYPLALVTSGRLGSINHTLLSLEACRSRGIELRYLVYNRYPVLDPLIEEDTLDFLRGYVSRSGSTAELVLLEPWD